MKYKLDSLNGKVREIGKINMIIILIVIMCLLFFGGNFHFFLHQSFQLYFAFCFSAILLIALLSYCLLINKDKVSITSPVIIILIWGAYVFIHSLIIISGEYYTVIYLISGIFYFISLNYFFSHKGLKFKWLYLPFVVFSVIQSIICILQFAEVNHSDVEHYKVCGTFFNPNSLAMLLAVSTPYFISALFKRSYVLINSLFLILILFAIYTLKCRTAYLGLITIIFVYGFIHFVDKWKLTINWLNSLKGALLILLLFGLFLGLYHYKRNSSDGRLFIWKVSIDMFCQNPTVGYGYGLFQKEYNFYQARYFINHVTTANEKRNANFVYMPYNDVIEQGIQGGIIGLLLFVFVILFFLFKAIKIKNNQIKVIIIATVIMSCVNFVLQSIPLWMLFLTAAAFATSTSQLESNKKTLYHSPVIGTIGIIFTVVMTFTIIRRMDAQKRLKENLSLQNGTFRYDALSNLKDIATYAGTSDIFFTTYGTFLLRENKLQEACDAFEIAAQYSTLPQLYYRLAYCYEAQGEIQKAEDCLRLIANMIPSNFQSRYLLMTMYQNHSEISMSNRLAQEILNLPIKKAGMKVDLYRNEAKKILSVNALNISK